MQPTQLGPYKIRSRLGRGGMGAVYEAEDGGTGQLVAVKTLAGHLGDDAGLRRRFQAEIETLKALRHPGIVRILAYGEEDGIPYFAMELVRGRSLEQVLRTGRVFGWRETVALAQEVVRALKSAHDHGVVHRDLKPANLLLPDAASDGAGVRLADFGIARLFGDAGQTIAGTVVGTAEFMAPEQAAGRPVDHRADLYALGLVIFAMLTGRPPFQGGHVTEVLERQRREEPPRLSSRAPDVPPQLDELVRRLLAKDPSQRPANALAVGRALAEIAGLPDAASEPPPAAGPAPGGADGIDPFGRTQTMPGVEAADGRPLTIAETGVVVSADAVTRRHTQVQAAAAAAHARTVPADVAGGAGAAPGNHFTTVAALQHADRLEAAAADRRHQLWQAAAVALAIAAAGATAVLLIRPRSADELHARIAAIAADEAADLRDARRFIEEFLVRHPRDPRVPGVAALARSLEIDALERRTRRRQPAGRPLSPIERDYRAAMAREGESPAACVAALEAILAVTPPGAAADGGRESAEVWLGLVRRQLDRLAPVAARERDEDTARGRAVLAEAAELAAAAAGGPSAAAAAAAARRRTLLESLIELNAARPHMATIVAEARRLLEPSAP